MTNDDLGMYQEFAAEMAATNKYAAGRAWESVGYTTNGEADDWGWGDVKAVSLTIEVGSSNDGFWPSPNRILPIAQESAWPARYLAWAAGPMLQIDGVQITPDASNGNGGELKITLQNNGLGAFSSGHRVCAHSAHGSTSLRPAAGWTPSAEAGRSACLTLPAINARSYKPLPALSLSWSSSSLHWIPLYLIVHPPEPNEAERAAITAAETALSSDDGQGSRHMKSARALTATSGGGGMGGGGGGGGVMAAARRSLFSLTGGSSSSSSSDNLVLDAEVPTPLPSGRTVDSFRLRIHNAPSTLRGCDELCMCNSADNVRIDVSHECRSTIAPGSHCKLAKPAHIGTNWASGVVDEMFVFTAASYSRGGKCKVESTKRDTLIAVYASCARFGAQSPLGFQNSERSTATVEFPCTAGQSYYLFWNAEYTPGRFSFSISESCKSFDCVRAHRLRHLMRLRKKNLRRRRMRTE